MKIYLLTHERELERKTNTGRIALDVLGPMVERVIWQRRHPDPTLLQLIKANQLALMYPKDGAEYAPVDDFENIVLIDSTWQEANKIYNRSPYLQGAPKIKLSQASPSTYKLRRNQRDGGLCTVECMAELLKLKKLPEQAVALLREFELFNH